MSFIVQSIRAVREGFTWLIPYLIIQALITFLIVVLDTCAVSPGHLVVLRDISRALTLVLPLAIAGAISAMLAIQWQLPRPAIAFLNVGYVAIANAILIFHLGGSQAIILFVSIVLPMFCVPAIGAVYRMHRLRIVKTNFAGINVKETLNLMLPAVAGCLVAVAVCSVLVMVLPRTGMLRGLHFESLHPLLNGMIYSSLNSLLWSIGIHGYYTLLPLLEAINLAAQESGNPVNTSFLGSFVFIGGCGATLSLVLAILLFGRSSALRVLAMAAIPIAAINVNEILLFGLPIILNPRLLLPFFCAPILHTVVAYAAISAGWVNPPSAQVPFNSPIVLNAYLATHGDVAAIGLQFINIFLGLALYAPFIRAFETRRNEKIYFPSLETTFSQRSEEAGIILDDPIGRAYMESMQRHAVNTRLKQLSRHEFFLQYQPSVSVVTGQAVSCEALLRTRDRSGLITYPGEFLPTFENAGLMNEIDLWVVRSVAAQVELWATDGFDPPQISINITASSLYSRTRLQEIADLVARTAGKISFEITERTLTADQKVINHALKVLREHGARIYIDDFGIDYSALSYLHKHPVDVIKIDRSFVQACAWERGYEVFLGIVSLADHLGLSVVVEGVESLEQLQAVPVQENISIQGWYFAKALHPNAFRDFVEERRIPMGAVPV